MEIKYSTTNPSRYFIIVDGIYELSTDSLEVVIEIIKDRPIDDIMLLDIQERKWIEIEPLLKK